MSLDKISLIWEKNHKVWDFVVVVKTGCLCLCCYRFCSEGACCLQRSIATGWMLVAAKGRLFAMGCVLFQCDVERWCCILQVQFSFKKNCCFSWEKNMNLELRWDLLVRWCCLYDTSSLFFLMKKLTWNFEEKNDFIALEKNQT
jgi:hypothetical protein